MRTEAPACERGAQRRAQAIYPRPEYCRTHARAMGRRAQAHPVLSAMTRRISWRFGFKLESEPKALAF